MSDTQLKIILTFSLDSGILPHAQMKEETIDDVIKANVACALEPLPFDSTACEYNTKEDQYSSYCLNAWETIAYERPSFVCNFHQFSFLWVQEFTKQLTALKNG